MSTLPAYLLLAPSPAVVDPPLTTTRQDLPLDQLAWEDFERLCLRLVQARFTVTDCEQYGIPGQDQQGIDLFARKESGRYVAYQCKRYVKLEGMALRKLVELFLRGRWATRCDEFVLCTSASLSSAVLQEALFELREELQSHGISFSKWDKGQLQRFLKKEPQIVLDFFGPAWVRAFNGEVAYEALGAGHNAPVIASMYEIGQLNALLDTIEREELADLRPLTAQRQLRNLEQVLDKQGAPDNALSARLYFLRGRAHQEMGETDEADRNFLRAYALNQRPVVYAEEAALAHVNQKQLQAAQAVATTLELRDPLNLVAAAVRLALKEKTEFNEHLLSLSAAIIQHERFKMATLLLVIGDKTPGADRASQLLALDTDPYRPSTRLTPANRRYQVTLALFVIARVLSELSPLVSLEEPVVLLDNADLRAAYQVVKEYTDLLQPTEKEPLLTHHYYVRGMVGWLLTGSLADYTQLRQRFATLSAVERQRYGHQLIFTLYKAGEYEAALEALNLVDTTQIPELGFIRYSSLRRLGRSQAEKRAALAQHLNELPQLDDVTFDRALIYLEQCETVAKRQEFVAEREERQQVRPGLPLLLLRAYAQVADATRHDEVRALLEEARALLLADTPTVYRFAVTSLYREIEEYEAAAEVLAGWPGYPHKLDQGTEWLRLNIQYNRRSDSEKLREDLRAWRLRYGIYGEFCRWEIELAELLLDWERVLEVVAAATGHLRDESGLAWAKLLALFKLGRMDEVQAEVTQLVQHPTILRRHHRFRVANIAAYLGQAQWVKQLLYPLASNRDDTAARGHYAQLLLGYPYPEDELVEFDQATLETMVLYSIDGKPQRRLALTNETVQGGLSNWAEELLGKQKGQAYILAHPGTGRRVEVKILEIHDLYTGLLREILDEARDGNPELPFEQLDVGEGEIEQLHAAFSQAMGAEGAARQLHQRQLFVEYATGEVTFTTLVSSIFQGNGLEAYHVLTTQTLSDVPGLVVPPRQLFTDVVVDPGGLFILDWTSLPLLYQLDQELELKPRVQLGISLHLVEFLRQKLQEIRRSRPIEITVEVIGQHVVPHFYAPEVHERHVAYLVGLLAWIDEHCRTRIVTEKLDLVRELHSRDRAHEGTLQGLLDTAFLATPAGAMAVSDDMALRQLSMRAGNIVSTEVFLAALYPAEFESTIVPKLLELHYLGLTLSSSTIQREFIQAGGQFTGRAMQCLRNLPRQVINVPDTMSDIVELIRELYLMGSLLPAHKSRAAVTLLTTALTHVPLASPLKAALSHMLSYKFQLLADAQQDVLTDLEQAWQIVKSSRGASNAQ
ncbi:MAG: PIN domain-containing protein [Janthinobacterium lividum]